MGLRDVLAKAGATLSSGVLTSEAAVQASVIRPILRELGWDDADPQQWRVEYPVEEGKVDEALIGPHDKPLVFVEAKRQGNLNVKAEDQLFGYAANRGVPLLVLTDGDTWDLYLSMAAGEPTERRFAHHKLTESSQLDPAASDFEEFLERDAVLSGTSDDRAKSRLKQVKDRELGKSGLETAWAELQRVPDEMLRDLLIERVEQDIGLRPWPKDAEDFLRRRANSTPPRRAKLGSIGHREWLAAMPDTLSPSQQQQIREWLGAPRPKDEATSVAVPAAKATKASSNRPRTNSRRMIGFAIDAVEHRADSGAAALRLLATELQDRNPEFLERWSAYNPDQKYKRPRAVRSDDAVLGEVAKSDYIQLHSYPGWWLLSRMHSKDVVRVAEQMTEVAGLSWQVDIQPIFG